MMQYSFHGIGDLGSQSQCEEINVESAYSVLSLNVSTTPVFIRQGICLPSTCTQGMFNEFSTKVSQKLTNLIQKAVEKFDIGLYILPPDTRVEVSLVDTSTIYSNDAYSLAVKTQDPSHGENNDDVPGLYGPQKVEALFWTVSVIIALWIIAVVVISILHCQQKRVVVSRPAENAAAS